MASSSTQNSNPTGHGVLTAEDIAQFESLNVNTEAQDTTTPQNAQPQNPPPANVTAAHNNHGSYLAGAPDTASAFASKNPDGPKNPYNPFLQQQPAAQPTQSTIAESQQPAPAASTNPFAGAIQHQQRDAPNAVPAAPLTAGDDISIAPTPAAAPAPHRQAAAAALAPASGAEAKTWATKDILFRGQDRKIIMQNENGPCSLLAIANILLLRGDVSLSPPDRPLVNYEYLSSLIAEYLLLRPEAQEGALDKALALLPQTQHGLNLNPSFLANDAFVDANSADAKQLALFNLLDIKLYHGFVPDSSSPAEYELATMAGSYDAAMDQVVRGEELAVKFFQEGLQEQQPPAAALKELRARGGYPVVESSSWRGTALQKRTLEQALSLSDFLDSNASQLTYPGLFALSALPEGTLAALFRFNHLSVFYRPASADVPPTESSSTAAAAPPSILTLITDDTFVDDELAVWETLADVDGRDSGDIYDSRLRPRPRDGAFAGGARSNLGGGGDVATAGEDADYALALQLHGEERDRAERYRQRREEQRRQYQEYQQQQKRPAHAWRYAPGQNGPPRRDSGSKDGGGGSGSGSGGGGFKGLLSKFGKKNKKDAAAEQDGAEQRDGGGAAV